LVWYPFVLFFTVPIYSLAGALVGALTAALVGAVSVAARSVVAGWLAGVVVGLALGFVLIVGAMRAPASPPPFGPGRPINPAANADEERELERNYVQWKAEQDQGERGGFIILLALPATLCALTSTCGAAWSLRSRHTEWIKDS
jgi:hypothetical protein